MSNNIPDWIKSKLFENVLKETNPDFEKILDFKVKHALAPGENYATVMLKIQIEFVLKTGEICSDTFMLKICHDSEFGRREIPKFDMFNTESNMYHNTIPELESYYKEILMDVRFAATAYTLPVDQDYVLLEDLTKKGFRTVDRIQGLDMEHCKAVLKKLAQWHAASAVRIEEKGLYEKRYTKGILNENGKDVIITLFRNSFKHFIKAAQKLENHEEYIQQLNALESDIVDLIFERCAPNEKEFNVLNHGDCWSNNIMFQYDDNGQLQETYFVDYQLPRYGSPAQDLLYFIISSAKLNIKINKFDYLIKHYHDNLAEHLRSLKYKKNIPSLKEIHQSLIQYGLWGSFPLFITMPVVLADSHKDATPDNLVGVSEESEKFKEFVYSNERITKHFAAVLPWLSYRGGFER